MSQKEIIILDSQGALAEKGADLFISLATSTIETKGRFIVALAGGTTPRLMHELLSENPLRSQVDWNKVHIFLSDERFVLEEDPDSNFFSIKKTLLQKVSIPDSNIHKVPISLNNPEETAQKYQAEILSLFPNSNPSFDLIFLGLGPDGHTASLFPSLYEKNKDEDFVLFIQNSPKPPQSRISFSMKLINKAKNIVVMASGKEKAPILKEILENNKTQETLPAGMINPEEGNIIWLLDREAASLLN